MKHPNLNVKPGTIVYKNGHRMPFFDRSGIISHLERRHMATIYWNGGEWCASGEDFDLTAPDLTALARMLSHDISHVEVETTP